MPEDIISLYQSRLIPDLLSQVMIHLHSLERKNRHCLPELAPEALNFDAVRRHRYE